MQNKHYGIRAKIGARTDAHLVWLAMQAGLVSERTVDLVPTPAEPNARGA